MRLLPTPIVLALLATNVLAQDAAVDTTVNIVPGLVVSGNAVELPGPDRIRIDAPAVLAQDPGSLADLGRLLPSVRMAVNSRGESLFMIRGAPERHVQIFLDDIPLNLAWDERVDLETIPVTGSGRIEATRGLTTLLDGPGALAGSARLLPPDSDGRARTQLTLSAGDWNSGRTNIRHLNHAGPWNVLVAAGWQGRNASPLPEALQDQLGRDGRLNSDLSQYSLLVRTARRVGAFGRWSVLAGGWSAEKGAPSELHLGDQARFWRYPNQRRGLLGTSLRLPLDTDGTWDLGLVAAADFFEQEIDARGPDGWDQPLLDGQDYEQDFDRTGSARLRLDRWLGEDDRVSLLLTARYAHHRESTVVGGGVLAFAQWMTGAVVEAELNPAAGWRVRAGAGWDRAATPETGDKTANEPSGAPALNLRITRRTGPDLELYAALSRRSRFPSLREQYSGALGRFVDNPDLGPERQDQLEVGGLVRSNAWRLETAAFVQRLSDGIERIGLPGPEPQYQRVNRAEIRVPGCEAVLGWTPVDELDVTLQHTILAARAKQDDLPDQPAEDRPDYVSRAGVIWQPGLGPNAALDVSVLGARWSADALADDGMRHLPAGAVWSLRLGWRRIYGDTEVEIHVRISNLFDEFVAYQSGLPGPGRVLSGGIATEF